MNNNIIKYIFISLILTTFVSCSAFYSRTLKVESKVFREIWQGDPCGLAGNRRGLSLLIEDMCNKKTIDFATLSFILGKPAKVDTLGKDSIRYSYIASAGTKACDSMPYNDVVNIGLILIYDFKKNKIISSQINLY